MHPLLIDAIGTAGALLTTLCWLPQVWKILRERDTRAISFAANFAARSGSGSGSSTAPRAPIGR